MRVPLNLATSPFIPVRRFLLTYTGKGHQI